MIPGVFLDISGMGIDCSVANGWWLVTGGWWLVTLCVCDGYVYSDVGSVASKKRLLTK